MNTYTRLGRIFRGVAVAAVSAGAVVVGALTVASYLNEGTRDDTVEGLATVVEAQQESAESTQCARQINAAGEIAQLEVLKDLRVGLLDIIEDGDVDQPTVAEIEALGTVLDDAIAGYEDQDDRCPVPGAEGDGDPNG